jgi:hypothetical protein
MYLNLKNTLIKFSMELNLLKDYFILYLTFY